MSEAAETQEKGHAGLWQALRKGKSVPLRTRAAGVARAAAGTAALFAWLLLRESSWGWDALASWPQALAMAFQRADLLGLAFVCAVVGESLALRRDPVEAEAARRGKIAALRPLFPALGAAAFELGCRAEFGLAAAGTLALCAAPCAAAFWLMAKAEGRRGWKGMAKAAQEHWRLAVPLALSWALPLLVFSSAAMSLPFSGSAPIEPGVRMDSTQAVEALFEDSGKQLDRIEADEKDSN